MLMVYLVIVVVVIWATPSIAQGDSWLHTQESLLVVLRGPDGISNPKANSLPTGLPLWAQAVVYFVKIQFLFN